MVSGFSESELVLLSNLLGEFLEIPDLSTREWAEAKVLVEKVDHAIEMLEGALDPHDKFFRG